MKTIGLLGGMSWESTLPYYRLINQGVNARLGGLHSARLLLYSVDFHDIECLQREGRWAQAGSVLAAAATTLQAAGAEVLVLCTNTMHKVAPAIEAAIRIPLLHIADPVAAAVVGAGFRKVGLLGTRFTMEQDFYRTRLRERHGIEVLVPGAAGRDQVHRVIYEELCRGLLREESRAALCGVIAALVADGAEAVVLACTEIGLLVRPQDATVPLYDSTALHAGAAVELALAD
ncbi:MAG: aspartate/glutamate racemase family protein [Xanthomonadales bacterium]|nr:aspartate/glutamate racemase family protein [Xanthomonadales bacterium]